MRHPLDRLPFIIAAALEVLRAGTGIRPFGSPPRRLTFTAEERELLDRLIRDTLDIVQSIETDVADALRDATPTVQPLMANTPTTSMSSVAPASGAARNLQRAGIPRSTAMKMVRHKAESIYRRYAIVDGAMLKEGAAKRQTLDEAQVPAAPVTP